MQVPLGQQRQQESPGFLHGLGLQLGLAARPADEALGQGDVTAYSCNPQVDLLQLYADTTGSAKEVPSPAQLASIDPADSGAHAAS